MKTQILKFPIINELDIILVHRRAIQLCEYTGISISDRTRFATAISEICRNCIEYAKHGDIAFSIDETKEQFFIESKIEDLGPGIKNLDIILKNEHVNSNIRGVGILHSRKLVDFFNIESGPAGTKVSLGMKVPPKHPIINTLIIKGWIQHFKKNYPVSPYEEIKKQNIQLLGVTEELKLKNLEAENQIGEIKALNVQLKTANQELEDFAYTISHDLKSPINNIEALVKLLNKDEKAENHSSYLKFIDTSIQRLKGTIKGLVEIIETQNTERDIFKDVPFEQVFEFIKDQYTNEIEASAAVLKTNFKCKDIKYYEAYLQSIMQNLINNSIKYKDPERPPIIKISTMKEGDCCLLKIKDNGIGMDIDRIGDKLFKPFTRFNNKIEGKGIGLHLVKNMVEKNGGRIEVESKIGKGTTFKIYLKPY